MPSEQVFRPPRLLGMGVQALWLLLALQISAVGVFFFLQGNDIALVYGGLALALLGIGLTGWRAYRLYALAVARYVIGPSAVRLQWGLRQEIIPLTDLLWARALSIRPPLLATLGGVTGVVNDPKWGEVEFMAAVRRPLVFLATPSRVYAISPQAAADFMLALQRALQSGRLQPEKARSLHPKDLVRSPFYQPMVRFLAVFTAVTWIGLLAWLGALLPRQAWVVSGFAADGAPLPTRQPLSEMLWLAVVGLALTLLDWLFGLLLYPTEKQRLWAWALWLGGAVNAVLMVVIYAFLLQGGG